MISRTKWLIAAAGAVAALAFGAPAAMAGTVVAVTGPSAGDYPVGTQIGDTQRISLSQGDRLTVLDNGGTRVFSGPGTFILARQGRQATNSAFGALTRQRRSTQARTGATRTAGSDGPAVRPFLWYVDLSVSGKMCVADPTSVRLWRNQSEAAGTFEISPVANPGTSVSISYEEKDVLAGWDSRLALTEGLIYAIKNVESGETVNIDFVFLEDASDDPEELTQQLIANGCMGQIEVLANNEDLRS